MSAELLTEYPITQPVRPIVLVPGEGQHTRFTPIAEKPEIIPSWIRNRKDRRSALRFAGRHYGSLAAFHTVRSPIYAARLALYSPFGLGRTALKVGQWWYDAETKPDRELKKTDDVRYRADLQEYRQKRVVRSMMSIAPLAGSGGWLALAAPTDIKTAVASVAVLGFGAYGRPRNKKLTDTATLPVASQRVTMDLLRNALVALQIGIKDPGTIRLVLDPHRDGEGWTSIVDLPGRITAERVMGLRHELAGALDRDEGMVWLYKVRGSESRLKLWLSDKDLSEVEQGNWVGASMDAADYFDRIPVGTNVRGELVYVRPDEKNFFVGAMTRGAKSTFIRALLWGLSLDPTVSFRIFDPKGTEFIQFKDLSEDFVAGRDSASLIEILEGWKRLEQECTNRFELLTAKGYRKVTREVVNEMPELAPMVVVLDECHRLFNHPEPAIRNEARRLVTEVCAMNASLAITIVLATQRGIGDAIPGAVTANLLGRFCGMVANRNEAAAILGDEAWSDNVRADKIEPNTGMGYVVGQGKGVEQLRVFNPTDDEVQPVYDRALFMRGGVVEKLDISPKSVEPVIHDGRQLLRDIMLVGPATPEQSEANRAREAAVTMAELIDLLYAHNEETYRDLDADSLKDRIERAGVKVEKQVNRRRGDKYDSLYKAVQFKHIETQLQEIK